MDQQYVLGHYYNSHYARSSTAVSMLFMNSSFVAADANLYLAKICWVLEWAFEKTKDSAFYPAATEVPVNLISSFYRALTSDSEDYS